MNLLKDNDKPIIAAKDTKSIQELIHDNPSWGRTQISRELCGLWNWYTPNGKLKDIACRKYLLKLHRRGDITLPPLLRSRRSYAPNREISDVPHSVNEIHEGLQALTPLLITPILANNSCRRLFKCFINRYHYLGYPRNLGENVWYLVFDRYERPLACLLFASAAWKVAPRDVLIGWDAQTRQRNLMFLTNNSRFLLLPWVRVKNLASHILAQVVKRLSDDWMLRYHHCVYLIETFVDSSKFDGASYRAANWVYVGETKGRTRQDRFSTIQVPNKGIYLYPLSKNFQEDLNQ